MVFFLILLLLLLRNSVSDARGEVIPAWSQLSALSSMYPQAAQDKAVFQSFFLAA